MFYTGSSNLRTSPIEWGCALWLTTMLTFLGALGMWWLSTMVDDRGYASYLKSGAALCLGVSVICLVMAFLARRG